MYKRYSNQYTPNQFTPQPSWQATRARRANPVALKTWSADQVWAAAVAAQAANGEYVKFPKSNGPDGPVTQPNKILMRELLEQGVFTAEQIAAGNSVREHFHGLVFEQMAGTIKEFAASALRISHKTEFVNTDFLDLAIVASLPSCARRDIQRRVVADQRTEAAATSQLVGQIGERITGEFTVVQCRYSQKWGLYTANATQDGNLFFMFLKQELAAGSQVKLSGTVKAHRDGNTTQLNRVKVLAA